MEIEPMWPEDEQSEKSEEAAAELKRILPEEAEQFYAENFEQYKQRYGFDSEFRPELRNYGAFMHEEIFDQLVKMGLFEAVERHGVVYYSLKRPS